jgi:hypothetical protein
MRTFLLIAAILVLAGCGETSKPRRVPDVRGQRLDLAEDRLDARGLDWEEIGGGTLGIVISLVGVRSATESWNAWTDRQARGRA